LHEGEYWVVAEQKAEGKECSTYRLKDGGFIGRKW